MDKDIKVMLASIALIAFLGISAMTIYTVNVSSRPTYKQNTMDRFVGVSEQWIEREIEMEEYRRNSKVDFEIMEEYGEEIEAGYYYSIETERLEFLRDSLDINPNHYKYYM